ncbi:cell division cycle protein 27 homolog isoform X2 [Varroa jacobsoni]|uniref:Cell division cycle protein 27 homolog n=1 Tax=Varroa destructor TaxID=109461 RepID=A0A7M7M5R5_VARDE|nr:cell division cycle protein 27 homolog isoform X2 [Varroa destructor]XP_022705243.1 cell division cycle protein 27 homolog isoform X2 [Varroa jacobsoni]
MAAIWQCLNQHKLDDAIFLSERLHAELHSDESLFLLGTSYYRAGRLKATKILLNESSHPQCRYLLARCCLELNDLVKAEQALTGSVPFTTDQDVVENVCKVFGDNASFALSLLGEIYASTRRTTRAVEAYQACLRLNPTLWSAFEALVGLGLRPDPARLFSLGNNDLVLNSLVSTPSTAHSPVAAATPAGWAIHNHGTNCGSNVLHCKDNVNSSTTNTTAQAGGGGHSISHIHRDSNTDSTVDLNSTVITTSGDMSGVKEFTPDPSGTSGGLSLGMGGGVVLINPQTPLIHSAAPTPIRATRLHHGETRGHHHVTPATPMFGSMQPVSQLVFTSPEAMGPPGTPFVVPTQGDRAPSVQTPDVGEVAPLKRTKKINQFFGQSTSNNNAQTPTNTNPLTPRRSTRLFTSNSIKENTTKTATSPRSARILLSSNRTPSKKSKSPAPASEKTKSSPEPIGNMVEELNKANDALTLQLSVTQMQRSSLNGLMQLLQSLARAFLQLGDFRCRAAVSSLTSLPPHQFETGYVLSLLGQAYFELRDYERCNETFEHMMKLFPFHLNGLELYSSSLWHKMAEKKLSYLAQTLVELEPNAPQTLCALGNCFSRQKLHSQAVEQLEKACRLHPRFQYAFTLLGHEYANNEELEKAMQVYRRALAVNANSYLVWSGLASVYMKQEQYSISEGHWRKAIQLNPENPTLLVHLGVALHQQSKSAEAVRVLSRAIHLEPKFALAKFHRATSYLAMDKCQEALSDLHELRTIAPHESMVYYLLGKVYKKLGKEHLALMNLSRATDMDPRGVYTQIKESLDPVRESGAGGRTDQSEGGGSISPGQTSTPISGSGGQIGGGHVEGPGHHSAATPQGHTHSRHPHSPDLAREFALRGADSMIAAESELNMESDDSF